MEQEIIKKILGQLVSPVKERNQESSPVTQTRLGVRIFKCHWMFTVSKCHYFHSAVVCVLVTRSNICVEGKLLSSRNKSQKMVGGSKSKRKYWISLTSNHPKHLTAQSNYAQTSWSPENKDTAYSVYFFVPLFQAITKQDECFGNIIILTVYHQYFVLIVITVTLINNSNVVLSSFYLL